ncbi:MAG: radical SAM protein, partial [Elusimicrobia bacterium]|nr:radical SAM protein [Elusimicrobiota bacterium]
MKSFGWDLTYNCNYKCHYCQVYADKEDSSPTRPLSDWVKAWNKIYEKYSECEIFISGGEPSVYPDFFQLIKELSKIHRLNICTNLSWDPEKLFEFPWPDNILISATFHPFNANPKEFISKIKSLKNNLDRVNFLLYPEQSDS